MSIIPSQSSSAIERFANDEFDIELIPDGDSFTVQASGLAKGLGFRDALTMVRTVPDKEKGYALARTSDEQFVWHLTEPGMYRVIGQRQAARIKNEAIREQVERFQSWVFGEVLPALRKHGRYEIAQPESNGELEMARRVIGLQDQVVALTTSNADMANRLADMQPKAEGYDDLIAAEGCFDMSAVAKILSPATGTIGRTRLLNLLRGMGIILQGSTLPEQKYIERGYFQVRTDIVNGKAVASTVATPKGLRWLQFELREDRPTLSHAGRPNVVQLPQQRPAGELG
ncbi:phage antirepressor KilAC domain-containing protein [Streptacidiphilus sp. EB129]|uniref:phage antirepressor KilAC domain-containing protein n=1 Tax=Streptacidiphilus sp. EB129 TaxID=3156262 RepID=UPI00351419D2